MRHLLLALGLAALACNNQKASGAGSAAPESPAAAPGPAVALDAKAAEVGQPAPDFTLTDTDGKAVQLSDHKGKIVVLEWFNPGCPYVVASHSKGSLVGTAARHQKDGVVWLSINSGAPGKQGAGREANVAAKDRFSMSNPILLDESGAVGKLYGAKTTPHLYVIDEGGVLRYRGAIDNSPDGEGQSPSDGTLVNYADRAIEAVRAKRAPEPAETKSYGCSVKYAS